MCSVSKWTKTMQIAGFSRGLTYPSDPKLCKLQCVRPPSDQNLCKLQRFRSPSEQKPCKLRGFTWFYISMRYWCDPKLLSTTACRAMFLELQISLNKMRPKPCKKRCFLRLECQIAVKNQCFFVFPMPRSLGRKMPVKSKCFWSLLVWSARPGSCKIASGD